jgi:hypothetical protein
VRLVTLTCALAARGHSRMRKVAAMAALATARSNATIQSNTLVVRRTRSNPHVLKRHETVIGDHGPALTTTLTA